MTVQTVFDQAMKLSEGEREDLVRRLLPTLPADDSTDPEVVAAAWHRKILDRLDRFERGETKAIPAAEVFERLERSSLAFRDNPMDDKDWNLREAK